MKTFKTPTEIQNETGRNFVDICNELIDQGYSPTEIALKLNLKHASNVTSTLRRKERESLNFDDEYTGEIKKYISQQNNNDRKTYELAFENIYQISFKDYLYMKYIEEKHSQDELGVLLGLSTSAISKHLKYYGIKKDLSEARFDAMEKGLINYKEVQVKGRKTTAKSLSKSNIQDWVRELFKSVLYKEFIVDERTSELEVIIGSNEWGILKDREVDIPIIVINNKNNTFIKYSIEFNNEFWHDRIKIQDQDKMNRLEKSGWNHYIISNKTNTTYSPIEKEVKKISQAILNDIKTSFL